MADYSWSVDSEETASLGDIARKVMSYGTATRNFDGNEMYITHSLNATDTLQGIALKYGVTMEHLRRVNRLWASDSIHLRKTLLIPIAVPLDGSLSRSRSMDSNGIQRPPSRCFTPDSNFPAGSRENPLSKIEALNLLKTLENEGKTSDSLSTPESSSSSLDAPAATAPNVAQPSQLSTSDYFSQLDQKIASCRKQTEITTSNWSSRSYSVEQPETVASNGKSPSSNGSVSPKTGISRSPSWGHLVRARKPHPELQLEGVDNMVFEL